MRLPRVVKKRWKAAFHFPYVELRLQRTPLAWVRIWRDGQMERRPIPMTWRLGRCP